MSRIIVRGTIFSIVDSVCCRIAALRIFLARGFHIISNLHRLMERLIRKFCRLDRRLGH